jgi:hypothetical protein
MGSCVPKENYFRAMEEGWNPAKSLKSGALRVRGGAVQDLHSRRDLDRSNFQFSWDSGIVVNEQSGVRADPTDSRLTKRERSELL